MAYGVPETEVFAAADRVLARGERPTVERVRLELGRGSPSRLGQLLEKWWEVLAKRLAGETRLPALPAEIASAFRQVWAAATTHAATAVEAGIAGERDGLRQAREALSVERVQWQLELDAARNQAEGAVHKHLAIEVRISDLQRLLDQQSAHLADLQIRHEQAVTSRDDGVEKLGSAQRTLLAARTEAANERAALATTHRAAEDRWLREVDRARQEETRTAARLKEVEQLGASAAKVAHSEQAKLHEKLRRTEHELAGSQAKVATLESQLDRLHAQLKGALDQKARTSAKPTTTPTRKRPAPTSRKKVKRPLRSSA
jgi:chromosome segregation ATPase